MREWNIIKQISDEYHWEAYGLQEEVVAHSPHIATEIGEARYLRIKIIEESLGL